MALTYIETNDLPAVSDPGAGQVKDVLNEQLAGAKNVVAKLRWLQSGDELKLHSDDHTMQLVYLMGGKGTIALEGKQQDVVKGAGVYLGPSESAEVKQTGDEPLKLFHLIVPKNA